MDKKYLQGYEDLTEETKMGKKWYIEILPPENDECGCAENYILQSKFFDTKKEAVEWGKAIEYADDNYIGVVCLMVAVGPVDEDGDFIEYDIDQEDYLDDIEEI